MVTFPAGKAINLKSGATYYFEIQADTIADTSSAFNVMGRTTLDRFTTVFAQVNLSALNENSISYSASGHIGGCDHRAGGCKLAAGPRIHGEGG